MSRPDRAINPEPHWTSGFTPWSRTIWKSSLTMGGNLQTKISIPGRPLFLSVGVQEGQPQVWYECDLGGEKEDWIARVYVTGEDLGSSSGEYVGTFQLGWFVGHVYTKKEEES